MSDAEAVALIAAVPVTLGVARDIWARYRTERTERQARDDREQDRQDRLAKEARDEDIRRQALTAAEADKRQAAEEEGLRATAETAAGLLSITDEELRQARAERDEARENVSVLRLALDQVVSALSSEIGRMRREMKDGTKD